MSTKSDPKSKTLTMCVPLHLVKIPKHCVRTPKVGFQPNTSIDSPVREKCIVSIDTIHARRKVNRAHERVTKNFVLEKNPFGGSYSFTGTLSPRSESNEFYRIRTHTHHIIIPNSAKRIRPFGTLLVKKAARTVFLSLTKLVISTSLHILKKIVLTLALVSTGISNVRALATQRQTC